MRISTFQLFVGDLNAHPSEPEVNDLGHPAGLTSIVTGNDSEQRNHGAHRYSNHLRGNIVHGHVNRMYTHLWPTIGALEENESGIGLRWGYETYPHPEKCLSNIKKKLPVRFEQQIKKGDFRVTLFFLSSSKDTSIICPTTA